jgi:hypothetical protein
MPWGSCSIVGSAEATTCVIAFVVCEKGVNVCHLDEGTIKDEAYMGRLMEGVASCEEEGGHRRMDAALHLVGGYQDEKQTGNKVIEGLLEYLHSRDESLVLQTAVISSLNTTKRCAGREHFNAPEFTSACFDMGEKLLVPAHFADKGPALSVRQCRCMSGGGAAAVYDAERDTFIVSPWAFEFGRNHSRYFEQVMIIACPSLLQNTISLSFLS